ncbi:hypothetical protein JTB14_025093 [Gonioctena quinquepunctata]|nr:hypothetical protein JTB14_025093 [Gonioctena quinquepunctata]
MAKLRKIIHSLDKKKHKSEVLNNSSLKETFEHDREIVLFCCSNSAECSIIAGDMFKLMFILLWLPLSNADNPCSFFGNVITCKGIQQEDFFDQLYRNEKFVLNNDVSIIEIMNSNYSRIESFYNPTSLFSRIRVSHLTIGNSSIETIATSAFKDLDLLRTLNLANNYIKDISFIENIPSLKLLDLSFNKMSVFDLNSLSNNFEHLIMRGNKIKEIVPSKEFKSCSYLDLSYNRLKNFNEALLNYFFHSLDLSHNRIRNVSLMDEFPLSKKTTDRFKRIVNLEGNNVTFLESIENKPFTCSQLFLSNIPIHLPPRLKIFEKFSVRNAQIGLLNRTKLDIGRLKYDPNLTIDFFNSSITDIADIFFWNVQCSLLNLSHNNLSILDKIIFSGSAIEYLDLSFSEIGFISTDFFMNLKPFPTVNLKGNYLKNVKDICKYTKFSVIDLSYNMMDSIGPDAFDGCSELHTLHISNSRISKIEPGTFSKLASLRKLDLSYNRFTLVDRNTFSNLRNIEEIDISGNYLEIIGTNAFSKSIVSDLRFFNTTIGIIKHKAFNGLSKLMILNISGTGIKNVEDYAFFDLPALKTIDMSNNNITIISSNTFSNLPISDLLLNGNRIKIIQSRAFDNMYFMKFLNLSLLGIQEMESSAFSSLKQLDTIDLRGNNISELKTNVFSDLFVSRIHLSGNNITNLAPINNYVAVTTLSLQFNGVLERHAIANAHLREVIFIDSLITFLKKDCFRGLYALESLNLINTEISAYETGFLNGLYHVTHLDVQILLKNTHVIQNNLFADLRSIKILQLSNLNLCVVEPEAFSGV